MNKTNKIINNLIRDNKNKISVRLSIRQLKELVQLVGHNKHYWFIKYMKTNREVFNSLYKDSEILEEILQTSIKKVNNGDKQ